MAANTSFEARLRRAPQDDASQYVPCLKPLSIAPRRLRAGNLAEHRIAGLTGVAGIIVKEQTNHVAGGIKPADRLARRAEHLGLGVDLKTAEGERDAADDRIGAERRLLDFCRPIRAFRRNADRAL